MQGTEKLTQEDEEIELLGGIDPDLAYCSATNRIVIISPLPQLIHELVRVLSSACYDVMVFHSVDQPLLQQLKPDLLIADLTRPYEESDMLLLRDIEDRGTQILKLINRGNTQSGTTLEWPLPVSRVLPVVRSLMDSSQQQSGSGSVKPGTESRLRLKGLTLDLKRYVVEVKGTRVDLTKTEFDLLRVIMEAQGEVLSRQDLMDRIWGDGYYGGSNTVDVHVKSLRQKLGDDPRRPVYVATVRGIGYRAASD